MCPTVPYVVICIRYSFRIVRIKQLKYFPGELFQILLLIGNGSFAEFINRDSSFQTLFSPHRISRSPVNQGKKAINIIFYACLFVPGHLYYFKIQTVS